MKKLIVGSKTWNGGRPVYVTTENAGVGSFLEPPFSKTHHFGVVAGYDRGNGYQEYSSVEYYLNDKDIPENAKRQIRAIIGKTETPPIESPDIQDWICTVMGYFKNCYMGQTKEGNPSWNASDLRIEVNSDVDFVLLNQDIHAGVNHIRKYYPDFKLEARHVKCAYWGKKKD